MEIHPLQILFQIINFSIVLFLLLKFLYNPIRKVLQKRSETIEAGMLAAEKNLKSQQEMEETIKKEVAKARKEATQIILDSKKTAQKEATEIILKAKEEAKKALTKERVAFENSIKDTESQVKAKLADYITDATAAVLKDSLSLKDQQAIISASLKKLKIT